MVGSLMLLKMLHCKRKVNKKRDNNTNREGKSKDFIEINIKNESSTDETCRICLKEGNLPIFNDNGTDSVSGFLNDIGGIKVCADDPYPKFLCQPCHALLQGAILFRKTAQKSDVLLKTKKTEEKSEPISDTEETCEVSSDDEVPVITIKNKTQVKRKKYRSCNRCDLEFNTFQEYCDHLLSEEHETKRKTCDICNKTYAFQYLKRHILSHKQQITHMCDICGKEFSSKGQFTRHRLTHFYDLPFKCSICPYRGRFSESLKMHMRSHTGERPYQCEQCPSRFISKSNLNKHMLTHKGEYDFRCEVCGRGFYTKRELELHIKVDHTGVRDHVCRICGKAFGYRKQMMKHELKVHKREKLQSGRMPIYLKVETMKQQPGGVATET